MFQQIAKFRAGAFSPANTGSLTRKKGVNAYIFSINSLEGIFLIVNLINGKLRTPKIKEFWRLQDWLYFKYDKLSLSLREKVEGSLLPLRSRAGDVLLKKPLDASPLMSHSWLSGFIEADGHFSVRTTTSSRYPKFECKLELSQRQNDHNNNNNLYFLEPIAELLLTTVKAIRIISPNSQYRIRTTNLKGNIVLESYLAKFPLFGSKYLDSKDWLDVLNIFKLGEHKIKEGQNKIMSIKLNMNDKRAVFSWDHLKEFYNLDN